MEKNIYNMYNRNSESFKEIIQVINLYQEGSVFL